jgi:hypothetical protein
MRAMTDALDSDKASRPVAQLENIADRLQSNRVKTSFSDRGF